MTDQISTLLQEHRRFAPPADFAAQANAQPDLYEAARRDRLAFWEEQARALDWMTALSRAVRLIFAWLTASSDF